MNEGEAESRTSSDYNKDYDDGDPESSGAAALNDDFELSADEDDDGHDDRGGGDLAPPVGALLQDVSEPPSSSTRTDSADAAAAAAATVADAGRLQVPAETTLNKVGNVADGWQLQHAPWLLANKHATLCS